MSTQNTQTFFILAGLLLLLYGCAKEIDNFIPDPINLDFDQEFGIESAETKFVVDGRRDTIIFTPRGTEFEIYAGTFVYEDGTHCPCETIEFQITEFNRAGDFIIDPTIDGTPRDHFAVEGLYHVTAKSEGQNIDLKPGVELHYHVPTDLNLGYGLLYAGDPYTWQEVEVLPARSGRVEFSSSIDGYEVYVDQLGWSGVGKDLTSLGTTHVCVDLDLLTHDKNAEVYAIGTTKLLVAPFYFDVEKECFCGELPLSIEVEIVVIRKSADDAYQFARQGATVTADLEIHMTYEPGSKTQSELSSILKGL